MHYIERKLTDGYHGLHGVSPGAAWLYSSGGGGAYPRLDSELTASPSAAGNDTTAAVAAEGMSYSAAPGCSNRGESGPDPGIASAAVAVVAVTVAAAV